jgi:hypothetical protein
MRSGLNKQATNQLNAFVNSVQTSLKTGKISAGSAATLISITNQVIATL